MSCILSKNFLGKKCVYASIRICGPPVLARELVTRSTGRSPLREPLFGGDARGAVLLDLVKAARERLALGIGERRRPRARDRVDAERERDASRQDRPDDAGLDQAVIGAAALQGIAIALDKPRTFRDFEREIARKPRRLGDEAQPRFDRVLLLLETGRFRPPAAQLGQQPEAQKARHRRA